MAEESTITKHFPLMIFKQTFAKEVVFFAEAIVYSLFDSLASAEHEAIRLSSLAPVDKERVIRCKIGEHMGD